ncbi:ABC transporter permease [candidate division KSB1 bacterium]|nr:ABC transporter permease [bacterium]NUM64796.1 ABC transporter permease [candidate division KSB1 bacterium]
MLTFLARRMLQALLLVWGVLTLTFFLMHASPGDPTARFLSPQISPPTLALLRQQFGFDQPLHWQYLKWLRQCLAGEWGYSLTQGQPVSAILAEAIPATLQLTIPALLLIFVLGITLGTLGAHYRQRWPDVFINHAGLAFYCMPSFWLGLLLLSLFALKLGWLPTSHAATLRLAEAGFWETCRDRLAHLVLPVLTLALPGATATARYVRENLVNAMDSTFIRLAQAKGLPPWRIMIRHALPHARLPLLSLLGLSFPFLLGGAFLTETVFAWPGMGRVTLEAIFARDYPVILAATALSAIMVIAGNLITDVCYRLADPRIKAPA